MLKKEHREKPTTGLKATLLLELLLDQVQLTLEGHELQQMLDYDKLKAMIKLTACVQTDYLTSQLMDIGEMEFQDETIEAAEKGKGPLHGSCWTCGANHFARSCPKGGGKGSKGFGEWEEKSKGKGKWSGATFGTSWTCGGNHFSRVCPKGDGCGGGVKGGGKKRSEGEQVLQRWWSWALNDAMPNTSARD